MIINVFIIVQNIINLISKVNVFLNALKENIFMKIYSLMKKVVPLIVEV